MNQVAFDFSDARVLVTGGSSGIGLAVAGGFAAAGAHVMITGRRPTATDYQDDLTRFAYRPLDVRDGTAVDALVHGLDGLDVLVNNAGANFARQPSEWDPITFDESVRINLSAAFRLAVACREWLAASTLEGGAAIINVASMASFMAMPPVPGYGAAKAGIVQLTKTLAATWASDGIRVNAIAPGLVLTAMTAGMKGVAAAEQPHLDRTPMRRWGMPDDVVPTVLYLASAGARFVTGQTWCVDGGYSAT